MDVDHRLTLNPVNEQFILSRAYVPEHIPGLMAAISQAVPFLIEDYIGFAKDNWVIFVGYPLESGFEASRCDTLIARICKEFDPEYLWFIGPGIPPLLARTCQSRLSDRYILLDLAQLSIKSSLQREVNQAAKTLTVEYTRSYTREHRALVSELTQREELPPMVAELYNSMPKYIAHCDTALVLNARDTRDKLAAFFVIELAAELFDTYLLGCHSKVNYAPHASDLLFAEMITYAQKRGKSKINLGLGVNDGIRRYKMKWGGKPTLDYEFCECYYGPPRQISILESLLGKIS